MASVGAATDRRFRRAHVKPSRRRSATVKRVWLAARLASVAGLAGFILWRAATFIVAAPMLQVGHIVVHGLTRMSDGEALALVDGVRGQNILTVKLDPWRETLLSSPWVEDATIRRVLPSTLEITVRERAPVGIGRLGKGLYLVDAHGVLIDVYGPNYADLDLPIIDGLDISPRDATPRVDAARAAFAARVIAALGAQPNLAARVSQIDVADVHDAVVLVDGDTALLRLGESNFVERLQQYLDLAPGLHERVAGIDSVDLRFNERLYVRRVTPASASARARR